MFWPFKNEGKRDKIKAQQDYTSLGNMLIRTGMITEEQLEKALRFQDENPEIMLGEALIQLKFIDRGVVEALLIAQEAKRKKSNIMDIIKFATNGTRDLAQVHGEVRLAALRLNGKPSRVKH